MCADWKKEKQASQTGLLSYTPMKPELPVVVLQGNHRMSCCFTRWQELPVLLAVRHSRSHNHDRDHSHDRHRSCSC